MIKDRLTQMPYEFTKLTPYTSYKITIGKGPAILFSQKVQTLDGGNYTVPTSIILYSDFKMICLH